MKEQEEFWDKQLEQMPEKYLLDYMKETFDLIENDLSRQFIEDFYDSELISELQDRGYNFLEESDTDELIDELQDRGYYIGDSQEIISITDSINLEELTLGFRELDFESQQLVLKLVDKLKTL